MRERLIENLFCVVNDAVQKAFTVLRGNIWRKTEYSINPQMTRTELVPPNKTKSTTTDMPRERSDFLKLIFQKRFFVTISANIL